MIDHMLDQLHEVARYEKPEVEIETFTCSGQCGATIEVSISDDSPDLPSEQRAGQLDDAGWIVTEAGVTCPDCPPVFSYGEEVDRLADFEREQGRARDG